MDVARAGAAIIGSEHAIILTEGNYLLLQCPPWSGLQGLFDLTVFLNVDMTTLEKRLVTRWLDYGLDEPAARRRAPDPAPDLVPRRSGRQKDRQSGHA